MRLSGCIAERDNRKIPKSLFVLPEPAPNAAWRFLALDCGFGTLTNSWLPGFRWGVQDGRDCMAVHVRDLMRHTLQ